MATKTTTDAPASAAASFEAEMFTDLARNALRRADMLIAGLVTPDDGTLALARAAPSC